MIEALLIQKLARKNRRERYTKNGDNDDNNKMSPAAAVIYLFLMVFSAYNAWNCFPKGNRGIQTILAFLFPIFYWIMRAFVPTMCDKPANYVSNPMQSAKYV